MPIRTILTNRNALTAVMVACLGLAACAGDPAVESDVQHEREVPLLGPEPAGTPTQLPIVLAHGFDASPTNRWGFHGVAEALRDDGHTVYVAEVPPYDSIENRAAHLADYVEQAVADGAEGVNIVAHSMGGLDARYLISSLPRDGVAGGYVDVVYSLSTISTPHRGSAVADTALAILDGLHIDDDLVNGLASAWGLTYSRLAEDSDVRAALEAIAEASAEDFNDANRNSDLVFYQSWAGVSSVAGIKNPRDRRACNYVVLGDYERADKMHPTLVPMAAAVAHGWRFYPNDGMVRVDSAKWGAFRGCIPTDHLDEVGYPEDGPDRRTGFSHLRFYRNLAFELSDLGY